mgnify:CR=1 FL=1
MRCPYCGSENSRVVDSRPQKTTMRSVEEDNVTNAETFTTYEKIETVTVECHQERQDTTTLRSKQDPEWNRTILSQTPSIHGADRSSDR